MICINDSGGARIQEGIDALAGYGSIFYNNTMASGVIPQISVIMGPCAGGAVYSPALTDFIFMVKGTSQMFITTGPQVIKSVTGESVTAEALTAARPCTAAGRLRARQQARKPASRRSSSCSPICRRISMNSRLRSSRQTIPRGKTPRSTRSFRITRISPMICTTCSGRWPMAANILNRRHSMQKYPAFLRMDGKPVGVIASQPKVMAGCLDINASDKASRFIRTCDCFNIPLLTIEDVPGFLPGTQQEYSGIIRHGAKLLYAYSEATVPKLTLITRKAYGGAYIGMCSKHLGANMDLLRGRRRIAVMGASGAANIIFSKDIKAAEDPAECRKEKIAEYEQTMMNPYVAASRGYVDDVIVPAETRKTLIRAFQALSEKQRAQVEKKARQHPALIAVPRIAQHSKSDEKCQTAVHSPLFTQRAGIRRMPALSQSLP